MHKILLLFCVFFHFLLCEDMYINSISMNETKDSTSNNVFLKINFNIALNAESKKAPTPVIAQNNNDTIIRFDSTIYKALQSVKEKSLPSSVGIIQFLQKDNDFFIILKDNLISVKYLENDSTLSLSKSNILNNMMNTPVKNNVNVNNANAKNITPANVSSANNINNANSANNANNSQQFNYNNDYEISPTKYISIIVGMLLIVGILFIVRKKINSSKNISDIYCKQVKMIDSKNKIVVIQYLDKDYILAINQNSITLIDSMKNDKDPKNTTKTSTNNENIANNKYNFKNLLKQKNAIT